MDIFSGKDFSAATWLRILKFGTKLDSDELYCVTINNQMLHISPFICLYFFLSNEIFVADFSVPIGASVLNFVYTFR